MLCHWLDAPHHRRADEPGCGHDSGMVVQISATFIERRDKVHGLEHGADVYLVEVAYEDITDIKQAEAAVRHQQELLLRNEKLAAMSTLLASVAHELNHPPAVVKMQVDILAEEAIDSALHERVSEVHQSTERCMRIVHNFLTPAACSLHGFARNRFSRHGLVSRYASQMCPLATS